MPMSVQYPIDIHHHHRFELGAGQDNPTTVRKYDAQTLRVRKEEQLVFLDWAAEGACPLMGNIERSWIPKRIIKPIVRV